MTIASRFDTPFLRSYARTKLATDPVFNAVAERLRGHAHPIVDVGCGIGLMPFYLREQGFAHPIIGVDHDAAKIASATKAASSARGAALSFVTGDARDPLPPGHSVLLIDVLHYFTTEEQLRILANARDATPEGGVVVIRDTIADASWRFRATYLAELFARAIRWIRAERLHFPTPARITSAFPGWRADVTPLWGRTPFNNYLFVFTKGG